MYSISLIAIIALLSSFTHQDCIDDATITKLGLVKLATPSKDNLQYCLNIHSQFNSCVTQESLGNLLLKVPLKVTRDMISSQTDYQKVLDKVVANIAKIIENSQKIKADPKLLNITIVNNTRLLQPTTSYTPVKTTVGTKTIDVKKPVATTVPAAEKANNTALNPNSALTAQKKNAKDLVLTDDSIKLLTDLSAAITANKDTLNSLTNPTKRGLCQDAISALKLGSLCVITSGAATTYFKDNTLIIATSDAANFTTNCAPFLYTRCFVRSVKFKMDTILKSNSTTKDTRISDVCDYLLATPACGKDGTGCSADYQKKMLGVFLKPFNGGMSEDISTPSIDDSVNSLKSSLDATIAKAPIARRLQSATESSSFTFSDTVSVNIIAEAAQSGVVYTGIETLISSELPSETTNFVNKLSISFVLAAFGLIV